MKQLKHVTMGDHELAAYLREHEAIDNYRHVDNATMWEDPRRNIVAMVLYPGRNVFVLKEVPWKVDK